MFFGFASLRGCVRSRALVILHQLLYFLSDAPRQVRLGRLLAAGSVASQSLDSLYLGNNPSWSFQLWLCMRHIWESPFKIHITVKCRGKPQSNIQWSLELDQCIFSSNFETLNLLPSTPILTSNNYTVDCFFNKLLWEGETFSNQTQC